MAKHFTAELKLEAAKLVVDTAMPTLKAAKAVNVSHSAIILWVNKLRVKRQGKTPAGLPLKPEQLELCEMKKKVQRLEMENEILKKTTALLILESPNGSRARALSLSSTHIPTTR
ncbi:MAG: transposase [Symbiopectobacterium sp.]